MNKDDVHEALAKIGRERAEWEKACADFVKAVNESMDKLVLEAARNFLSAERVASLSGFTPANVRSRLRSAGLDTKRTPRFLAYQAAEVLNENAELMGLNPGEVDLLSPLAYLPMGDELRGFLETKRIKTVHELSGTEVADGWWCDSCEFFEQDDQINTTIESCELCGCPGESHFPVVAVAK